MISGITNISRFNKLFSFFFILFINHLSSKRYSKIIIYSVGCRFTLQGMTSVSSTKAVKKKGAYFNPFRKKWSRLTTACNGYTKICILFGFNKIMLKLILCSTLNIQNQKIIKPKVECNIFNQVGAEFADLNVKN